VSDPGVDDRLGDAVVAKRLRQDLTASRELTAEDPVGTVSLVEGAPFIDHRTSEVLRSMLVLETFDPVTIRALKEKANHRVVEAAVDEIVDDCPQHRLSADLVEVAHLRQNLGQGRP
jgi:hypothetical protein